MPTDATRSALDRLLHASALSSATESARAKSERNCVLSRAGSRPDQGEGSVAACPTKAGALLGNRTSLLIKAQLRHPGCGPCPHSLRSMREGPRQALDQADRHPAAAGRLTGCFCGTSGGSFDSRRAQLRNVQRQAHAEATYERLFGPRDDSARQRPGADGDPSVCSSQVPPMHRPNSVVEQGSVEVARMDDDASGLTTVRDHVRKGRGWCRTWRGRRRRRPDRCRGAWPRR